MACHVCGKDASLRCSKCGEGLDRDGNLSPIFYCGRECQAADWDTHKKTVCHYANARKQLYRGGALVQDVFLALREATFDLDIKNISISGDGKVHITCRRSTAAKLPIFKVPTELAEYERKKQLLSWRSSNLAVGWMYSLIKRVLKGIVDPTVAPTELAVSVKDFRKHVAMIGHFENNTTDQRQYEHVVIHVKLIDGEEYIIDATGSQFGQHATVLPAFDFTTQLVDEELAKKPLGSWWQFWRNYTRAGYDCRVSAEFDPRVPRAAVDTVGYLEAAFQEWDARAERSIISILKEKKVIFDAGRKGILAASSGITTEWIDAVVTTTAQLDFGWSPRTCAGWEPLKTDEIDDATGQPLVVEQNVYEGPDRLFPIEEQMKVFKAFCKAQK